MTGNLLLDLTVALVGVAVLVAVSALLGGVRSARVSEMSAAARLSFDEPDFARAAWRISADGRAAFCVSADGREGAVVFAVGDKLATRRFPLGAVVGAADGARLVLRFNDVTLPALTLVASSETEAQAWAGALQP